MKKLNVVLGLSAALVICASGTAQAARVGVYIGGGGYYYPWAPYYYPPAPVVVPVPVPAPDPQEYVEQGQGPAQAGPEQSAGTWYYCDASKTYYPYVKECRTGWRPVPAQPSGPGN